ncbi:hypothetical protein HDU76_005134 [Blyttiomyces sp. JEL0837]|nr:hypothetical protein HDU76_005134 [Blyttiomyces sp. JEL0837]
MDYGTDERSNNDSYNENDGNYAICNDVDEDEGGYQYSEGTIDATLMDELNLEKLGDNYLAAAMAVFGYEAVARRLAGDISVNPETQDDLFLVLGAFGSLELFQYLEQNSMLRRRRRFRALVGSARRSDNDLSSHRVCNAALAYMLLMDTRVTTTLNVNYAYERASRQKAKALPICKSLLSQSGLHPAPLMMKINGNVTALEWLYDDRRFWESVQEVDADKLLIHAARQGSLYIVRSGNGDLIDYLVKFEEVQPSASNNLALKLAVELKNGQDVVRSLFNSGKLIDSEYSDNPCQKRLLATHKYWIKNNGTSHLDRGCFNILLHEVCYENRYEFIRAFMESGYCDVAGWDGFAFQMFSQGVLDGKSAKRQERLMDFCQYLGQSGRAIRGGMSTKVLVAAAVLPRDLFESVVNESFSLTDLQSCAGICSDVSARSGRVDTTQYLLSLNSATISKEDIDTAFNVTVTSH